MLDNYIVIRESKPGLVTHTCNPSTWETESQARLHGKTMLGGREGGIKGERDRDREIKIGDSLENVGDIGHGGMSL